MSHLVAILLNLQFALSPLVEANNFGFVAGLKQSPALKIELPTTPILFIVDHVLFSPVYASTKTPQQVCSESGRQWFSYNGIEICVTQQQYDELNSEAQKCNQGSFSQRIACAQGLEQKAYEIVLNPNQSCQAPSSCTGPDKVFNCMFMQCLTTEQNTNLTNKANECKTQTDINSKRTCVQTLQVDVNTAITTNSDPANGGTGDLTNGVPVDPCMQTDAAVQCRNRGLVWDCQISLCLTVAESLVMNDSLNQCKDQFKTDPAKLVACQDGVKKDFTDFSNGSYNACDVSNDTKAQECKTGGQTWNCLAKMCLTSAANANINSEFDKCRSLATAAEKDACNKNALTTVAEYKIMECNPTSAQKTTCQASGLIWSCIAEQCITSDEDTVIKQEYNKCQSMPTKAEQDACVQKWSNMMAQYGGSCETTKTAEKALCESEGKVWSCSANYCLTPEYNAQLRKKAVDCYVKDDQAQIDACMKQLEEQTVRDIASGSQCPMDTDKAKNCDALPGHTWNCNVSFCVSDGYNQALTDKTVACYQKATEEEKSTCMNQLEKDTARDIASGALCDNTTQEYKDCSSKGMVWNCNLNFCVTKEYNDNLTAKTVLCYDKTNEADQEACLSTLKQDTVRDIASGALCDAKDPAALECANEPGKVWNCQVKFCVPKEYNDKLTESSVACYENKTPAQSDACIEQVRKDTIADIAGGALCDNTTADAVACTAEGKVWNCNVNFCLTKEYNDQLVTKSVTCYSKPNQTEIDQCMEQLRSDTIADISGGALCDKSGADAVACQNDGKIWNCLVGYCLTQDYNKQLTDDIANCYKKPTKSETESCIAGLKDKTVGDIAGGALCDKTAPEAQSCEAKPGHVYNCEVKFCLTKDYNDSLALKAKECFNKSTQAEKDSCMRDLKQNTAQEIASGALCDQTIPEATSCAAEGKVWNCNVNFCLPKDYNEKLATDSAQCYSKPSSAEAEACMEEVKSRTVADIAGGKLCDQTTEEAKACKEGESWNCMANMCLTDEYNKRIADGAVECYKKPDQTQIDSCMNGLRDTVVGEIASGENCSQETPEAKACSEKGEVYNCHVKMCLTKSYNDQLASQAKECYAKGVQTEVDACLAELKKKTVQDIASGSICDQTTQEAKDCASKGRVYNCNVKFCVTQEYNQQLTDKAVSCYDKPNQAQIDSCMAVLKDETVTDVASGSLCESDSPQAKECTDAGKVFNCNINFCVTKEYNDELTTKVVDCYGKDNQMAIDACMSEVETQTVADLAGGSVCDKTAPDAMACEKSGKVWNCEINYCVTQEYNDRLVKNAQGCQEESDKERRDKCMQNLRDQTVVEIASGSMCENIEEQNNACKKEGKKFNCNVNYCVTDEYNGVISARAVDCYNKPTKAEINSCMSNLEYNTAKDIAGGVMCDKSSDEAKKCSSSGKVYNCNVEYCLTNEQNDQLANETAKCQVLKDPTAKEQCMASLESKATEYVIAGGLCDQSTSEAQSCKAKGRVWNCNMNLCITQAENEVLTEEAVRCNSMATESEKNACYDELKQVGVAYLATECDTSGNSAAQQCKASGKVWNCHANKCVTEEEHRMLTRAILRCEGKPTKEEKDACHEELKEFEKLAKEDGAVNIKDLQYKENPVTLEVGLAIAIAGVAASAIAGCMSAAMFGVAALMTPLLEGQVDEENKAKIEQLKSEYAAMEARQGLEGVTYENQVEAFEFYKRALETGAEIADKKRGNMTMLMGMFGAATGLAAADIAMGFASCPACNWAQITCGSITAGLAGAAMGITGNYAGVAANMAKTFRERAAYIDQILERFKVLFGPDGGLDTTIAKAEQLKGKVADKNSRGNGDGNGSSGPSVASGTSSPGGTTSINNGGGSSSSSSNGSGGTGGDTSSKIASSDPANGVRTCLGSNGKVDKACNCQKNNSCTQFKLPMIPADQQKLHDDLETAGMLKDATDISTGKITVSHLDFNAMSERSAKAKRIALQLIKNANKDLKKLGKPQIDLSDKALVKFINARVSKKDIQKNLGRYSASYTGVSADKLNDKNGALKKAMGKGNTMPKLSKLNGLQSLMIMPKKINLNMLREKELEDGEGYAEANSSESQEYEYVYEEKEVVTKKEISIWRILSNRYLMIRRAKRLGSK